MNIRLIIVLLGACLAAMGCTNDNESDSVETNNDSIQSAWLAKYCYIENYLFKEQTDAYGDTIRVSAYGEVLNPIMPTVYSLAVEDEEEAHRFFKEKCIPPAMDSIWEPDYDATTVDLGEMGTITYQPNSSNGVIASIVVDIPTLPELSRIDFIQKDSWPTNSISIFKTGEILMLNETKELFMVVRECEGGHTGLMMNSGDGAYMAAVFSDKDWIGGEAVDEDAWQALLALTQGVKGQEKTMRKYFESAEGEIEEYCKKNDIYSILYVSKIIGLGYMVYDYSGRDMVFACGKPWKVQKKKGSDVEWVKFLFTYKFVELDGEKKYLVENHDRDWAKKIFWNLGCAHVREFTNSDESKYTRIFKYSF